MMIDYARRFSRARNEAGMGYGDFGTAYAINDGVTSAQFCLPYGHKFVLFSEADHGGDYRELVGNAPANMQTRLSLGAGGWSSGCFMLRELPPYSFHCE
jgi:hypothetical protein